MSKKEDRDLLRYWLNIAAVDRRNYFAAVKRVQESIERAIFLGENPSTYAATAPKNNSFDIEEFQRMIKLLDVPPPAPIVLVTLWIPGGAIWKVSYQDQDYILINREDFKTIKLHGGEFVMDVREDDVLVKAILIYVLEQSKGIHKKSPAG